MFKFALVYVLTLNHVWMFTCSSSCSAQLPCATMMSVDVTGRGGPTATPPTTLNLRSSHNQLLSSDVIKQGSDTPPKCRKKYALTSIQTAMGLGEAAPSSPTPSSSPAPSSTSNNPKLAKNGVNQLRKAGQDHNKNTADPESTDVEWASGTIADELDAAEEPDGHTVGSNEQLGVRLHSDRNPEQEPRSEMERHSNGNATDVDLSTEGEQSDDISILSEKEMLSLVKTEEGGDEVMEEEEDEDVKKRLLLIKSGSPVKRHELTSDLHSSFKGSPVPPPPFPPRRSSPEDAALLSSSSSSSSPETRKDRRTGAKTDWALNRIQNLNPSDEELSWTTLSQESNSPEETGTPPTPWLPL